jgi:hypothetical protein
MSLSTTERLLLISVWRNSVSKWQPIIWRRQWNKLPKYRVYLFLFLYRMFTPVASSGCIVSNGRMISKQWIGKKLGGSGSGLIWGSVVFYLQELRERNLSRFLADICIRDLQNTKEACCSLDRDTGTKLLIVVFVTSTFSYVRTVGGW